LEKFSPTRCPHCGSSLEKCSNPQLGTWSGEYQYVCFNDECPYFVRGWQWMKDQYDVTASYRFRFDPETGEKGPLPVWSQDALRSHILQSEVGDPNHGRS
jgi:hypothetical protein